MNWGSNGEVDCGVEKNEGIRGLASWNSTRGVFGGGEEERVSSLLVVKGEWWGEKNMSCVARKKRP